jgi:chloride channel protein, CIC family
VAGYGLRFWALVLLIGALAGLSAAAFVELLGVVEHLAWSYSSGDFLDAVTASPAARRVLVLTAAGALAGVGALVLKRLRGFGGGEVSEALWLGGGRMSLIPSLSRGVLSIVIVGMGASLGREAAPQLAGGAFASGLCERAHVPAWQRRLLVACGAGAGMAAVYNVPLGGALFAVEVLLGTLALPFVLPALATSVVATAVAWTVLGNAPIYTLPVHGASGSEIVWAVIAGPLAGLAAAIWVRMVRVAHGARPIAARARMVAPLAVFAALGATAIAYPQLLGNGQDTVELAVTAQLGVGLLAALVVLKPLATAGCLGSGAPGGLFTPTLTYGVLFGGLLGYGWIQVWPGTSDGAYAVIGGAAVLAASMQGPLAAVVLTLELAHFTDTLIVPILIAVTGATVLSRRLGLASIYSARLDAADPRDGESDAESARRLSAEAASGEPADQGSAIEALGDGREG